MTALVKFQSGNVSLLPAEGEWRQMTQMAAVLLKSGFLPNSIKSAEAAVAIMLKGRELSLPPMQSFSQIHVIQGKPCISSELMLALIRRGVPGAKVIIQETTNQVCRIAANRPGENATQFSFSIDDAKLADLLGKDNWRKFPRAMLRARAISEMARAIFPDATMGCSYTPEEMGATVDEDGEVIDVPEPQRQAIVAKVPEQEPVPKVTTQSEPIYYHDDPDALKLLHAALKGRKVPETLWDAVGRRLDGRPKLELTNAIDEAKLDLSEAASGGK